MIREDLQMNQRIINTCTALSASVVPFLLAGAAVVHAQSASSGANQSPNSPIVLQKMGSMYAGGTLVTAPGVWDPTNPNPFGAPAGQTLHADGVYAQYKIP